MNLRQIQDIAGHRNLPPWVIKLVQDCIEHDRMYERKQSQDNFPDATKKVQGEWVDLTDDEIEALMVDSITLYYDSREILEIANAVIAKFKEKNAPPVAPQGEPVAEKDDKAPGLINWLSFAATNLPDGTLFYPTTPSVEAMRIETLEKVAQLIESGEFGIGNMCSMYDDTSVAAAIRSMK